MWGNRMCGGVMCMTVLCNTDVLIVIIWHYY